MIDKPVHSLTFGDLVWIEEGQNPPDESGVVYRVKAQDASFGSAVPVTVALLWLGRAGGPVSYDRTDNRQPVFRITIEADDSDLLARGEMALQLACEQPTTLVWTPPDGASEPSVFDIVWSHLEPVFDRDGLVGVGAEETLLQTRTYLVRMQALPDARGADLVLTPAQGTATETVVDACSSDTGWATSVQMFDTGGVVTAAVSTAAGRVVSTISNSSGGKRNARIFLTRTGTFTPGTLVSVDLERPTGVGLPGMRLNGIDAPLVSTQDLGSNLFRFFFQVPGSVSSVTSLAVGVTHAGWPLGSSAWSIDKVSTWTAVPFIGTARQKALSLVPGGSKKTQGSIQVAHDTDALGQVIVYTHESGTGYLPPLRPWLVDADSESSTSDSSLVSGARTPIGPIGTHWRIPAPVLPRGRAELWAWLRATDDTGVKEIGWSVSSWMNGTALSFEVNEATLDFPALNNWYLLPIGAVTMPPVQIGPAGYVEVAIQEGVVTHGIEVDEAYLFATEAGHLTSVYCGAGSPVAGGPSNRLWIDAPTPAVPMGALYRGNAEDRSDAWHAGGFALPWEVHDFEPAGMSVFVVTQNALDAETSLEHYRRYNTYVSREDR